MALPIRTVIRPAILSGLTNGKLPASVLVDTPGLAGGPVVRLVAPAARAWRALTAAASKAGHTLKATSLADSYRPYSVQESVFRQRYTTTFLEGRPYRVWNGVRWYQRPGTAPAAVPGTSNHGWGLAVDTGEERDTDLGTESMDAATLAWLVAHELNYGFSHELESEPWHIRYWAGDAIPAAVLAYEQGDDDMFCAFGDNGPKVEAFQRLLLAAGGSLPQFGADADYGAETVTAAVKILGGDGKTYGPVQYAALAVAVAKRYATAGPAGPEGPRGPAGEPGRDGVVVAGTVLVVQSTPLP